MSGLKPPTPNPHFPQTPPTPSYNVYKSSFREFPVGHLKIGNSFHQPTAKQELIRIGKAVLAIYLYNILRHSNDAYKDKTVQQSR